MQNRSFPVLSAAFVFCIAACSNGNGSSAAAPKDSTTTDSAAKMTVSPSGKSDLFTVAMVDNKKDPSCGMPVTAGIGDTVHYQGKVIGFCSKECKDEFLKDPVAGIKKTEFKK